jgi:catechol 2,3-dioxygenase-like lactoylglutathione lyase family enzyme
MKSHFYHLQFNIDISNKEFYRKLMEFMGWKIIFENADTIGFKSKTNGDLWFYDDEKKKAKQDYDAIGVNHIAIRVDLQTDIDRIVDLLPELKVQPLFDTPRHRPEYVQKDGETYYQVMFETPDKLLFEIVYIGPK